MSDGNDLREPDDVWAQVRSVIRDAAQHPDPWGAAADHILARWVLVPKVSDADLTRLDTAWTWRDR